MTYRQNGMKLKFLACILLVFKAFKNLDTLTHIIPRPFF
ncbi:hypothetical protein CSC17_0524 [Klebsiella oxytoca]|nr:hypothetical protein CSC17_0524 [Klebsiella oxytoca]